MTCIFLVSNIISNSFEVYVLYTHVFFQDLEHRMEVRQKCVSEKWKIKKGNAINCICPVKCTFKYLI